MKYLKGLVLMVTMSLFMTMLVGCGASGQEEGFTPLPINIAGTEMKLGESTMQTLIDAGFKITEDKDMTIDVQDIEMEPRTYDLVAFVSKDGQLYGYISFINPSQSTKLYKECIINEYSVDMQDITNPQSTYKVDNVLVHGDNFYDMDGVQVKEVLAKHGIEEIDETLEPTGEVGALSYKFDNVHVGIRFSPYNQKVSTVETEVFVSHFE